MTSANLQYLVSCIFLKNTSVNFVIQLAEKSPSLFHLNTSGLLDMTLFKIQNLLEKNDFKRNLAESLKHMCTIIDDFSASTYVLWSGMTYAAPFTRVYAQCVKCLVMYFALWHTFQYMDSTWTKQASLFIRKSRGFGQGLSSETSRQESETKSRTKTETETNFRYF